MIIDELPRFSDTLPENIIDGIQADIEQHLFDNWTNSNLDEGTEYAEWSFMAFAPDSIKKAFNEYYNLNMGDDYYIVTSDKMNEYFEYHKEEE